MIVTGVIAVVVDAGVVVVLEGGSNSCFADASRWGVLMRLF